MMSLPGDLTPIDLGLLGAGALILHAYLQSGKQPANGPLPPGPKGLPVIGNLLQMPTDKDWLTYAEWGRQYGGICSVTLLGRPLIFINSMDALEEFDKRSAIYSQRPRLPMGGELVGYDRTLVMMPYGPRFRHYRKSFAQIIGVGAIQQHHEFVDLHTRKFLARIAKNSSDIMGDVRKLAGAIILGITYGYDVKMEGRDPWVDLIEGANENFNKASQPGAYLVDLFPSLANLPEWLPGMGFIQTARRWRKDTDAMVEVPYTWTRSQIDQGTAGPSFVSKSVEVEGEMNEDERRDIKFVAASMYGGGADTTVSAEYAFYLAMVLHPEVQVKAREELDRVIGTDRLPTQADAEDLPYLRAVVTELLRWNSVAPGGVPHVAIEDGWVGGYFIPKDSMIVANLWGILHDPALYPEPTKFSPERFLGPNPQTDPRKASFGFGRRICPGQFLAEASLWSFVSMSLAVFEITNVIRDGEKVIPVHENTNGTISYPKEFECAVRPRSSKVLSLLAVE